MNELRFEDPHVRSSTALELEDYRTADGAGQTVASVTARKDIAAGHDALEMAKGVRA